MRCQVAAVLAYAHDNVVEPFLEPVLELTYALLDSDRTCLRRGDPGRGMESVLQSS